MRISHALAANLDMAKSSNPRPQGQGVTIWLGLRTRVRFRVPPPILKPQLITVGAFFCLFAPVPACCWGFLRKPADFASRPNWPFRATFHSLLAIPRSDLAPWNWPEVRKGRESCPYRSKSYTRTNQAVGLQHWLAEVNCHQVSRDTS